MPCSLNQTLKGVCNWASASEFMNSILSNTVWISVVITIIMIIIIMLVYPAKSNTPFWIIFKTTFYIFTTILAVMLVRDGVMKSAWENKFENNETKEILDNVLTGNKNDDNSSKNKINVPKPTL